MVSVKIYYAADSEKVSDVYSFIIIAIINCIIERMLPLNVLKIFYFIELLIGAMLL